MPESTVADIGIVITTTMPASRVGDLIWLDTDLDGTQDLDEPGLAGVVVRLVDAGGATVDEQITDAQGRYEFAVPSIAPYSLEVVLPDGYEPTMVDIGLDDAVDSDADPVDVMVGPVETTVRVAFDLSAGDDMDLDVGLVRVPDEQTTTTSTTSPVPTFETTTTQMPTTTETTTTSETPTQISTTTETATTTAPPPPTTASATSTTALG
jgi:serine-aspartate repeat-containing protein C/D/E